MTRDPDGVVAPFRRPDPLAPILPNPFGEVPVVVPIRPGITLPAAQPTVGQRIVAALERLRVFFRSLLRGLMDGIRAAGKVWARFVELMRIPRRGWRSPARTWRRANGPVTRAVRIDRRRRRARLRRTTRRRRTAA